MPTVILKRLFLHVDAQVERTWPCFNTKHEHQCASKFVNFLNSFWVGSGFPTQLYRASEMRDAGEGREVISREPGERCADGVVR
jgi:hypothetical protein